MKLNLLLKSLIVEYNLNIDNIRNINLKKYLLQIKNQIRSDKIKKLNYE